MRRPISYSIVVSSTLGVAAFISPWVPPAWLDGASPRTQLDVESVGIAISLCFKLARLARTLAACFAYLPRLKFLFMNS